MLQEVGATVVIRCNAEVVPSRNRGGKLRLGNDEAAARRGRCIHGLGLGSEASVDLVAPSVDPSRTYPTAGERDSSSVSLIKPRVKGERRVGVR